jgi:outer membrane protein TolC
MPATPPLISGQLNGQRIDQNELSGEETSENDERGTANITGVLPIDLFGRNRRAVEAARANLAAAKAELRAQTLAISADIAQEYLSFRGNQRQLELLRESVSLQEKTLDIVTKRFNSGLSPELDLQRARTSVENLRADIPPW